MDIKRALRIQDDGESVLIGCYSHAAAFGLLSAEMEQNRQEALARLGVYKAPRWVQAYLSGYWRAKIAEAYRCDLVYGAIVDGRFYSTHRDRADYYEKNGIEPAAFAEHNPTKGHYWAKSLRPFFVSVN